MKDYRIIEEAKQVTQEIGYKFEYVAPGFLAMILAELRRLNTNIETLTKVVQPQTDKSGKTQAMIDVEMRFEKSISELLRERRGKSVREIASELGVSKSTVSEWRRQFA